MFCSFITLLIVGILVLLVLQKNSPGSIAAISAGYANLQGIISSKPIGGLLAIGLMILMLYGVLTFSFSHIVTSIVASGVISALIFREHRSSAISGFILGVCLNFLGVLIALFLPQGSTFTPRNVVYSNRQVNNNFVSGGPASSRSPNVIGSSKSHTYETTNDSCSAEDYERQKGRELQEAAWAEKHEKWEEKDRANQRAAEEQERQEWEAVEERREAEECARREEKDYYYEQKQEEAERLKEEQVERWRSKYYDKDEE